MNTEPTIVISGLTRYYGKFTAVSSLSLRVDAGEIYGFLGLNGAGKTTTIRMMLGMIKPDEGTVSIFGSKVQPGQESVWNRVGYMVETPHAYPELTVRENLEVMRRLRKLPDKKAVDEVIEKLGLTREAGKPAGKLSLGNGQRLGLAKALIHHPDLLILDEPANGLDPAGIVEIRNLLRSLAHNHGVTIFMSSHILGEVAKMATRIGIIHEGKLIKELDTIELERQNQLRLRVGVSNRNGALQALEEAGIEAGQDGNDSLIITDENAMKRPEFISTVLVEANCPPYLLVTEHGDLESYFLSLVERREATR